MSKVEQEIWRAVPGSNCVEASNLGRVRQFGKVLEQVEHKGDPYLWVKCTKKWGKLTRYVHQLVALAWLPLPADFGVVRYEVNHIDEQKQNNRFDNLAYMTKFDHNSLHKKGKPRSVETIEKISNSLKGKPKSSEHRANMSKAHNKPVQQLTLDGALVATFPSIREAERQIGIFTGGISKCCKGNKNYPHVGGFVWRYVDE